MFITAKKSQNQKSYISPMFQKTIYCICLLVAGTMAMAQQPAKKPVTIIFDTDMGPDYDDVGAIALLHALADSGQAKILATIASTKYDGVAAVLNVLNTYFNRPDMPVGVPKGNALKLRDVQHWTDTLLAKYPHTIKSNDEAQDAIDVYRKTLASQPDQSVTIVTVGFLTNLAGLLNSKPDQYSKLNGKELIKKKVKQLVCMAGKFPLGDEFNVDRDAVSSRTVFDNWSTPVIFSGFEIGMKIKTGLPIVHNANIHHSPVKDVFTICTKFPEDSMGRMSWDETAALVAVKGYQPYYRLVEGKINVAANGSNTWDANGKGQFYLVETAPVETVKSIINTLMMHQPVKK